MENVTKPPEVNSPKIPTLPSDFEEKRVRNDVAMRDESTIYFYSASTHDKS
jgi:hypothetical protein